MHPACVQRLPSGLRLFPGVPEARERHRFTIGQPVAIVPIETETACCIAASYRAKAYGVKTGNRELAALCRVLKVVAEWGFIAAALRISLLCGNGRVPLCSRGGWRRDT